MYMSQTITQSFTNARDGIRGDEALLKRIISQIPEKKARSALLFPYTTYMLTSCVSLYALFLVIHPVYTNYQMHRAENDSALMEFDLQDENTGDATLFEDVDNNTPVY